MNDGTWYGDGEGWNFDPLEMERYEWLNHHYFHNLLKPKHHLSIQSDGHRSIMVRMMWMAKKPHDLIIEFAIDTQGAELSLRSTKVSFDGKDAAGLTALSQRDQKEIDRVHDTYCLAYRLKRLEPDLREHCVRSALENWRRMELICARAEEDFSEQNDKVVSMWHQLQQAKQRPIPEGPCEEGFAEKRIPYLQVKAAAEKLCLIADQARFAADVAKADAMKEVAAFRARYPEPVLPIDSISGGQRRDGRLGM